MAQVTSTACSPFWLKHATGIFINASRPVHKGAFGTPSKYRFLDSLVKSRRRICAIEIQLFFLSPRFPGHGTQQQPYLHQQPHRYAQIAQQHRRRGSCHGSGAEEHAAQGKEHRDPASALIKAIAAQMDQRAHGSNQRKQVKAVIQNDGIPGPDPESADQPADKIHRTHRRCGFPVPHPADLPNARSLPPRVLLPPQ